MTQLTFEDAALERAREAYRRAPRGTRLPRLRKLKEANRAALQAYLEARAGVT